MFTYAEMMNGLHGSIIRNKIENLRIVKYIKNSSHRVELGEVAKVQRKDPATYMQQLDEICAIFGKYQIIKIEIDDLYKNCTVYIMNYYTSHKASEK